MAVAFWIVAAMVIVGAVLAVTLRNLIHCVLSLVLFFLGIAVMFFLLRAEFLGAVQILIYVGAVGVLFLFAIMLTHRVFGERGIRQTAENWWLRLMVAALVFSGLFFAIGSQTFSTRVPLEEPAAQAPPAEGELVADTGSLGEAIMSPYLLPFEVVSVLLTAGMIGAIVIAMEEKRKEKTRI
jgi:NADH-quinone oxidoreductase subunit J